MRWALPFARSLGVNREDVERVALLMVLSLVLALLVAQRVSMPALEIEVGEVAPRTVTAPYAFVHFDDAARRDGEEKAKKDVEPVFVFQGDLANEQAERVSQAFSAARTAASQGQDITETFRAALGVHLPARDVSALAALGFPDEAEAHTRAVLQRVLRSYILADRNVIASDTRALELIELRGAAREETTLTDFSLILSPDAARQRVGLVSLELRGTSAPWSEGATAIARALIRPNLSLDPVETERRRAAAVAAVQVVTITVPKGATLFRAGDELTEATVSRYRSFVAATPHRGLAVQVIAAFLFMALTLTILFQFGANYLPHFSTGRREVLTVAGLLIALASLLRLTVALSPVLAPMLGAAEASALWYLAPVAAWAMLVRLLIGQSWALVVAVFSASLAGVMMELQALPVIYFTLTGLVASGLVHHTRERMAVVRAGLVLATVSAIAALILHFLGIWLGGGGALHPSGPTWAVAFAALGGLLAVPVVLALIPVLEGVGFVTDYRLMELASLDHPLLRNLMLRSPGSYHHSVLVGSLAEAGCQAIGANALHARVAAYYHDIGKSAKPRFFIENQRDVGNRHDNLDPHTSARIIIGHVTEGLQMAREHRLPKPILDNIAMHHGTGLLRYFFLKAKENADEPASIRKSDFMYPGPLPNTREAGILMLADKVEAATRTISQPSADAFRAMIQSIVNSVMADGQFDLCPLTFAEIHTVAETFVEVLLGVYHQRIEYPETAQLSRAGTRTEETLAAVMNLDRELCTPDAAEIVEDETTDYEALAHLPGNEGGENLPPQISPAAEHRRDNGAK